MNLRKIFIGDNCRKTRLHDEKGNLPSLRRLILNGSRAYYSGLGRVLFDRRPIQPWISYDAAKLLRRHLTSQSRVLEFGSGMSTRWYAEHAGFVLSIEDYQPWFDKVRRQLTDEGITHVQYILASEKESYAQAQLYTREPFDLIMVDGSFRSDCIAHSLELLNEKGILYLDNSDKDSGPAGGDVRRAEELALAYARKYNASVQYFTDFSPTQFIPSQGLMIARI